MSIRYYYKLLLLVLGERAASALTKLTIYGRNLTIDPGLYICWRVGFFYHESEQMLNYNLVKNRWISVIGQIKGHHDPNLDC